MPLKKPTNYDSPQQLFPESGNMDIGIEHDGASATNIAEELEDGAAASDPHLPSAHLSDNTSCKDSGIQSNMRSSNTSEMDSDDEDDSSFHESTYDSDEIEIEGVRRRRDHQVENLEPINFPPIKRSMDSHLIANRKDQVATKIFSEVARIGHDFAFGKKPSELFDRIEKQLPVVFTLQDDVGDTPLNNAILKGNLAEAERILRVVQSECKWALDLVNTSGQSALILAPACDVSDKFIQKLLNAGCDLEKKDDLGKSALTYAVEYNNTPALITLLEYIKEHNLRHLLNRSEKSYFNVLQLAVMNAYEEGVKLLLFLKDESGQFMVDVNERALMNDDTALHIAVERNVGVNILKLLLERPDIDINHKKDNATTVLHTALKMNLTEIIMILKQNHAEDSNDKMDSEEMHESADELEVDDDLSPTLNNGMCMTVEISAEVEQPASNVAHLTDTINQMSIKGHYKNQLIDLLLNGSVHLSFDELQSIVRPAFKTLFPKYDNTNPDKSEIIDVLDRFNCLPNSFGQIIQNLREINRPDMITKVMDHFDV